MAKSTAMPAIITTALIERALAGDQEALSLLLEAIDGAARPAIGALLRERKIYRTRDVRTEMEDRLQDLLAKLWADNGKRLRDWDPNKPGAASFDTYIGKIAKNAACDHYKKPRETLLDDDTDAVEAADDRPSPEDQVGTKDYYRKILDGMKAECTTPQKKDLFSLIVEEGLTVEEICDAKINTTIVAFPCCDPMSLFALATAKLRLSSFVTKSAK